MNAALKLTFRELVAKTNPGAYKGILIALDPGETTGYTVFDNLRPIDAGQLPTQDLNLGISELNVIFAKYEEHTQVVCEDYKVYSWKTEQHNWANLHTPKLIGVIHTLCYVHGFNLTMEMAVEAKQFCSDDMLKVWGFDQPGKRHARDAIRHAAYWTIFKSGKPEAGKSDA